MRDLVALGQKVQMQNYKPLQVVLDHGKGAWLVDVNGQRYVDFVAGVAVSSLGYGDPELTSAVCEQAGKILHTSNLVWNEQAVLLEEALVESSFADRVFLCNSGAEANEAMLKLARKYFSHIGEPRTEIVCMDMAFHGRTLGTISATGQEKYKAGFGPLLPGFKVVPFGEIEALKQAVTPQTAAVIVEPILGEGGVLIPPKGYLKAVRQICDAAGCLMLLDEVQSGMGRTGHLFAYQIEDAVPDAMTLAKGLAGGLPIGALLTTEAIAQAFMFPAHGSTFGGNPVCCAAARVVLNRVKQEAFLRHVRMMGELVHANLQRLMAKYPQCLKSVRGVGLWFGAELTKEAGDIREKALANGLIINLCGANVLRIAPPLVIDKATLEEGFLRLEKTLEDWN